MHKKWVIIVIVLLLLIGSGYWFYTYRQHQNAELTLYGNVDIRTVNLGFRVGGRLAELSVDEGNTVKPGQFLGRLDNQPYHISLEQAKANVEAAEARLSLLKAGYRDEQIAQAEATVAQLKAALKYAESFYQRQLGLWAKRANSANDLENAKNARDQAKASLQAAQEQLSQYQNGNRPQEIAEAQANLAQQKAAQAQAELNLKDTELYSPSEATVLTRALEPGTMISSNNTVFTLSLTKPVWVRAYVDEQHLSQAIPGTKVQIFTDGQPDRPYQGEIGFVSPTAEFTPKTVETTALRTDLVYRLRIIVTNADPSLRQGMPVTIKFAQR